MFYPPLVQVKKFSRKTYEVYPGSSLGEKIKGIPTGRDVDWEPLVDFRRNGVSEIPFTVLCLV